MVLSRSEFSASRWRLAGLLLASAASLTLNGCGNGLAQVSGHVTLDGQPLRGQDDVRVTVQFQPADGVGVTAIGLADENGRYQIATGSQTGIPPGDYLVTCTASQVISSSSPNGQPAFRQLADPKYASAKTSGLTFTVQPGSNEFNIILQRPPKTSSRSGA